MTDDESAGEAGLLAGVPWRRLARVGSTLLLLAVVVPFLVYAAPGVVGAEDSYVVLSGSMEPTMSPGDVILVSEASPSEIEAGDVITFAAAGDRRPTTHRVVEVVDQGSGQAFRTQGDNNENPDPSLVSPSEVGGKVMSVGGYLLVIPLVGYVIQFTSTPLGLVALLVAPLGVLVVSEVWQVVSDARSSSDEGGDESDDEADDAAADAAESAGETGAERETAGTAASGDDDRTEEVTEDGSAEVQPDATGAETAGVTFTAAELQLGLGVLFAFLAYSVWVAYATLEAWAFAVAASVLAMFLLVGGLYVVGGEPDETDDGGGEGDEATASETDQEAGDGEGTAGETATGERSVLSGESTDDGSDGRAIGSPADSTGADTGTPRLDLAGGSLTADWEEPETEVEDGG